MGRAGRPLPAVVRTASPDADPTTGLEPWALPERTPPDLTSLGADLRSASQAVDSLGGRRRRRRSDRGTPPPAVLTMGSQDMSSPGTTRSRGACLGVGAAGPGRHRPRRRPAGDRHRAPDEPAAHAAQRQRPHARRRRPLGEHRSRARGTDVGDLSG